MPVNVFGQGAVQTAYVAYLAYPNFTSNLTLYWPSTYTTQPNILAASTSFTPSMAGLSVTLPDATQVSLGMNALITNAGSYTFTILNNNGVVIGTVLAGNTNFIQLTAYPVSPDLTGGTWLNIIQGAGTSSADAAALAGFGLVALGSPLKLNTNIPIQTISGNYTLQPSDRASLFILTGGIYTIQCPDNGTSTVPAGFNVSFNNAGTGIINFVGTTNTALFDGIPMLQLYPSQTMVLDYDGVNYWTVGLGSATSFATNILNTDFAMEGVQAGGNIILTATQATNYIQQFYCSGGALTGDVTVYYPSTASTWYIANFTTGATVSVALGSPSSPVGTSIIIPNGEKYIIYVANASGSGTLQLYNIPTVITPSSTLFGSGTVGAPSIAFSADPSSGLYLNATYVPTMASHGVDVLRFNGTDAAEPQLLANTVGASYATYSFEGATSTGMGCNTGTGQLSFYAPGGPSPIGLGLSGGSSPFCNINWVAKLGLLVNGQADIVGFNATPGNNTGMGIGIESTTNQIQFYSSTGSPPTYAKIASLLDTSNTTTTFALFEESAPTATGYMKISGAGAAQVLAFGTTADQIRLTAGTPNTISLLNNTYLSGGFGGNPTTGDICYFNGTNWVDLPIGTMGQVLTVSAGLLPSWV